jgi:uncharacterized protein (DUF1501 family)
MLVLGKGIVGGKVYADAWPGLADDALDARGDLVGTTEYRDVLGEILVRRLGNPRVDLVFPGYAGYSPLGVVTGQDLPTGSEVIFADGYDSGNTNRWDATSG